MLTMLGFFGMVNCYTLRVNLSVAIVAMVNSTWVLEQEAAAKHENATTHHNPCITGNETESKDEDENVRMTNCFLRRRVSFASPVYATGGISVGLSHFCIVSKRGNAEGCSLHHRVALCL